jgi:hypothetical protein
VLTEVKSENFDLGSVSWNTADGVRSPARVCPYASVVGAHDIQSTEPPPPDDALHWTSHVPEVTEQAHPVMKASRHLHGFEL